jgi:hypothetical protein
VPAAEQQHDPDEQHGHQVLRFGRRAAAHRPLAHRVAQRGVGIPAAELAAQEPGQAGRTPHVQPAQLEVGHLAHGAHPAPLGDDRTDPAQVPHPRRAQVPGVAEAAGEHGQHDLHQRQHRLLEDLAQQEEPAVVGEHHAQPVAGLQLPAIVRPAFPQGLNVAGTGRRRHQHPGTGQVRPPAQVGVLAVERHRLVEPAEGPQQVSPDQEAGTGHEEHVPHAVVLLLVQLPPLAQREGRTEAVGAHADGQQGLRLVPADQLRPDDAGVGAVGLLYQQADGVGGQRHIVVADQEERRTLHHRQRPVDGGADAGVGAEAADVRMGR